MSVIALVDALYKVVRDFPDLKANQDYHTALDEALDRAEKKAEARRMAR